jgi:hypothetical protein
MGYDPAAGSNSAGRIHNIQDCKKQLVHAMRTKPIIVYLFISVGCIHLGAGFKSSAADSSPNAEIPIFHDGYNVKKVFDPFRETWTVKYRVQTLYPAAEVLEFYDVYFNGKGWISSFETCQRNWMDPGDRTKASEPDARLLFASWEHAGSNQKVLLWIRHQTHFDERQDEVVVEYQLQTMPQN